jgi:hypothetical protein
VADPTALSNSCNYAGTPLRSFSALSYAVPWEGPDTFLI